MPNSTQPLKKGWRWKLMGMRIVVNALAIALTAFFVPQIDIMNQSLYTYIILAAVFGLLNAFVKPVVEFFTLSLLFVSYGLVVIIINATMLYFLSILLPNRLVISSFWGVLIGGMVVGLLGLILESLVGLTPPIIDDIETSPEA